MIQGLLIASTRRRVARLVATVVASLVVLTMLAVVVFLLILAGGEAEQVAQEEAANGDCDPQVLTAAGAVPGMDDLTQEQTRSAATIVKVARRLGVSEYGQVVAIATAWQESKLTNLTSGDRDSRGLFQQRPSTGWGSSAQVTDPVAATRAFFGRAPHTQNRGLLDVAGWEQKSVGEAAQSVQASADPTGAWYAQHEMMARRVVATLGDSSSAPMQNVSNENARSPVEGKVSVATANIPMRAGEAGFRRSMPQALSRRPDFVALQEQAGHSLSKIDSAAPGYNSFRDPAARGVQAKGTVVLWKTSRWTKVDAGRVELVSQGPQQWDAGRSATWVMARNARGSTVSMVSVHMPVNPGKYGPDKPRRQQLYGQGMQKLIALTGTLSKRGPVFVVGDFNTHAEQRGASWSAAGSMQPAGYDWVEQGVDFIFYNKTLGVSPVRRASGPMASDHPWVAATFAMNGAGASNPAYASNVAGSMCGTGAAMDCPPSPWQGIETGLTPDALRVLRCVHQQFPEVQNFAGLGERDGNPGTSHGTGRAVDAMIENFDTRAGQGLGDRIAAWVQQNAAALGVRYVIWDDKIWSVGRAAEGWRPYTHPSGAADDTSAHRDHVHVDVYGNSAGGTAVAGAWGLPVRAGAYQLSSGFGECSALWVSCHTGQDLAAPEGTPILAAASGTVVSTGVGGAYGNLTKIDVGGGVETWYAHQSVIDVRPGQRVEAGQVIGRVGSTGNSTGPHLHFEVREHGAPVDPRTFLKLQGVAA